MTIEKPGVLLGGMKTLMILVGALALATVALPFEKAVAYGNNYNYQYVPTYYQPVTTVSPYYYGSGQNMSQDQLANYLRLLVVQLQTEIAKKPTYNYNYGYGYGYPYSYVVSGPRSKDYDYRYRNDHYYDYDDEPSVDTLSATDIKRYEARLRGRVDMNDADDGEVFFVYGTDRGLVEDVEDDFDSYSDVSTRGDRLRKLRVDSSLDGSRSYDTRVSGLSSDTRYYFSLCVGFEDGRDDRLICGNVNSFTTDW